VSGPFSRRSEFARDHNRWELARSAALREGRALLDLTESNPTRAGLPVSAAVPAALAHPDGVNYRPEPLGLRSAREALGALTAREGAAVAPERIVLSASTSEAYAFLFKLLCDPGDEVLVPAPSYPLLEHLAQLEGVRVRRYPLAYDGRWHVDLHALRAACGPRTRAIVVVHPNNPTGSYLKRDELAALARLGVPIISDEVFAAYPLDLDESRAPSARVAEDALVFSLHGLSKLAGLPQLKLAWTCVSGPAALAEDACARLELIADSFLSVSTPVQLALPAILDAHAATRDAIRARLRRNLQRLQELAHGTAASPLHVEGGWYAVLRLPELLDDEAWALDVLKVEDVLVQPGYFYDFEGGPFAVLGLLTPETVFAEGTRRLIARVQALSAGGG
jgi:aspartate/methionine/tyrosine aminotransferase